VQKADPKGYEHFVKIYEGKGRWMNREADSLVVAQRDGQTVQITSADKVAKLLVRFDDRIADLDKPITIIQGGKDLYASKSELCNLTVTSPLPAPLPLEWP
jgi:hypothetical protein